MLHRLPAAFAAPASPAPATWRAPREGREESEIEFSWVGETARHVGTVVHRWLQRIAEDELRGWDAPRVNSLRCRFESELKRRGVTAPELKRSADLIATALINTLSDDRGRWILGPRPDARNEYRLRMTTDEGTRSYVIDRVFLNEDRVRWVVDYKTSGHEGANVESFLDREQERYADQLRSYSLAIRDSRQGLYFPLLRGWRQTRS